MRQYVLENLRNSARGQLFKVWGECADEGVKGIPSDVRTGCVGKDHKRCDGKNALWLSV